MNVTLSGKLRSNLDSKGSMHAIVVNFGSRLNLNNCPCAIVLNALVLA